MPAGQAVGTATAGGAVAGAAGAAASTAAAAGEAGDAVAAETRWDHWDCRAFEAGPYRAADLRLLLLVDCFVSGRLLHPLVSPQQQRRSGPAAPLLRCDKREKSGREEVVLLWAEL